ncbi:hypothetical protein HBB16_03765 [Pseudonocardia sp. MCCB 268]|nr:hypothetical protein [Pseudonocardia cytotoxica]
MLPNRAEFVVTLFAAWRPRRRRHPREPELTADERSASRPPTPSAQVVVGEVCSDLVTLDVAALRRRWGRRPEPLLDDDALALLDLATSGTTGRPKASCSTTPTSARWST